MSAKWFCSDLMGTLESALSRKAEIKFRQSPQANRLLISGFALESSAESRLMYYYIGNVPIRRKRCLASSNEQVDKRAA